jgi:hypothetical protein
MRTDVVVDAGELSSSPSSSDTAGSSSDDGGGLTRHVRGAPVVGAADESAVCATAIWLAWTRVALAAGQRHEQGDHEGLRQPEDRGHRGHSVTRVVHPRGAPCQMSVRCRRWLS